MRQLQVGCFCSEDLYEAELVNTKEDLDHWLLKTDALIHELQAADGDEVTVVEYVDIMAVF